MKMQTTLSLVALSAALLVNADVYMHNPRGANDRNCETDENRRNGNRIYNTENNAAGGYACPRAWPFACYTMMVEADRDACNQWNADQNYDDISALNMADNDGVLHPRGTRTPKMYYYEGSVLQIEWTNQHGCGENPRTHCDIVLQYACEDTLTDDCGEPDSGKKCGPRDGVPITNSENERGDAQYVNLIDGGSTNINRRQRDREATATIPISITFNVQSDPRFGRHEPLNFYVKCRRRERNKGLFTADQNVREDATGTRQNPNGDRDGYECPEEYGYYPYWHPSPWKDIAILTDQVDRCPWIVSESQNVKEKYECVCPTCITQNRLVPNNRAGCTMIGGTWVMVPAHNIPAPVCGPAPTTRENQLGNPIGGGKSASSYNWTIPYNVPAGKTCVLRLRYNISTGDPISASNPADVTIFGTSAQNAGNSPIKDRQQSEAAAYKSFVEMPSETHPAAKLGLAMNTNQFGRTFQDRSYTFEIRKSQVSGECAGRAIYNLNVRGKRGNIVQTYPAVEYDYVPNEMYITDMDCVHVQWTGSDYNPARNANDGYGGPPDPNNLNNGRADRSNMVQLFAPDEYQPVTSLDYHFTMFSTNRQRKINLAFIGQPIEDTEACMTIEAILSLSATARNTNPTPAIYVDAGQNYLDDNNDRDRYWKNCGKLSNAKTPYFDGGLFVPGPVGTYYYVNTRSNSFSNRNMQGILHVQSSLLANGSIIYVIVGSAVGLALAAAAVISYRRRSHRNQADSTPGAPGTGLVALLPFGRRGSPHQVNGAMEPAAPAPPRRARPGVVGAAAAGAAGGKAEDASTTVTALHNHQASEAGELEFRKGDVITVLRKDDSGWWEGRTPDGKKGIFPANYVRLNN